MERPDEDGQLAIQASEGSPSVWAGAESPRTGPSKPPWLSHAWTWHHLHLRLCLMTLAPLPCLVRRSSWGGKPGPTQPALLRVICICLFLPHPTLSSVRANGRPIHPVCPTEPSLGFGHKDTQCLLHECVKSERVGSILCMWGP